MFEFPLGNEWAFHHIHLPLVFFWSPLFIWANTAFFDATFHN